MASKVLVKIPAVNFNQVGKHGADLVNTPAMCQVPTSSPGNISPYAIDPVLQVNQLEQNVRFLKDQHQIMLSSLHQEIEILRNRNRDLQFQMVFAREDSKRASQSAEEVPPQKVYCNQQIQTPFTDPEVERLEREVSELRLSLNEARKNNEELQGIIDEQQRRMEELSIKAERSSQPSDRERSLSNQLQETVQLVHRMSRFHDEQTRELAALRNQKYRTQPPPSDDVGEQEVALNQVQGDQLLQEAFSQSGQGAAMKSLHQYHHQAHRRMQHHQHQQVRHQEQKQRLNQFLYPRDLPSAPGDLQVGQRKHRFPPLPPQQNYWQNNGQSKWTNGTENGQQRPSVNRPVQSMPSLPAINSNAGTPNSGGRRSHHHYFRGGTTYQDNPDGTRKFRGRGSGGRSAHRYHEE